MDLLQYKTYLYRQIVGLLGNLDIENWCCVPDLVVNRSAESSNSSDTDDGSINNTYKVTNQTYPSFKLKYDVIAFSPSL